jgi:TonB family protein
MTTKTLLTSTVGLAVFALTAFAAEPATREAGAASSQGVSKVAHISGMDKAPQVVSRVAPAYPLALREKGIQGVATVELLVDSTGRVIEATAVRSTTPEFASMAVEAAKQWQFKPAEAAGHAITSRIQVPFEFVMPQVAALDSRQR